VAYLETPIALDGISVMVNPANDFVGCLSVSELREIWRPNSQIRSWRDLRPELPATEIELYGPGTDSGTFDFFTQAIVGEMGSSRADYQASEDDNVLVRGLTGDRNALGYFGYAYLVRNREGLKVLAVDGGGGCVTPTPETIGDGSYSPLGRQLFLYLKVSSLQQPGTAAFVEYFMLHAQDFIPATGFLPLPQRVYEESLRQVRRLSDPLSPSAGTAPGSEEGHE
jgi:phosphate transport system substrate-binding protein